MKISIQALDVCYLKLIGFFLLADIELNEFYQIFGEEMNKEVRNIKANDKQKELGNISNDYMYELSAVVTHKGYKSTETGHYVADIFR